MIDDKRMGEYCEFAKRYVPIVIKYFPDGSSSRSCEESACGNPECSLSACFRESLKCEKGAPGKPERDME